MTWRGFLIRLDYLSFGIEPDPARTTNNWINKSHSRSFSSFNGCLGGKYAIIQASNQPTSGRKGDTLIRTKIQGGFVEFSYKSFGIMS